MLYPTELRGRIVKSMTYMARRHCQYLVEMLYTKSFARLMWLRKMRVDMNADRPGERIGGGQ